MAIRERWFIQFVGYKTNPETGEKYRWTNGPYSSPQQAEDVCQLTSKTEYRAS